MGLISCTNGVYTYPMPRDHMTNDGGVKASTTLSPDEAFNLLGNETRLQILQALGEADEPLTYSELFNNIEYDDPSNFNYHIEKLVGHFVRRTDEGYKPRLAGRRVVQAILSGVVTENPVMERTDIDSTCMYCDGTLEIGYHDEVILLYCTECEGQIDKVGDTVDRWPIASDDIVGYVSIPPAGVYDRSPSEVLDAAAVTTVAGIQQIARGICPRCTATLDRTVRVCEKHDDTDQFCDQCGHQFGLSVGVRCTNCIFKSISPYPAYALGHTDLIGFMIEHGIDPFTTSAHLSACNEIVLSTDPLRAQYTFTFDDDSLTLTVDEDLAVAEARRSHTPETG